MIATRLSALILLLAIALSCLLAGPVRAEDSGDAPPHIVLVMSDDQGWGQVGYMNHLRLTTPHLDEMAEAGLRFDRFYAGANVCSPTRATVLTGRSNDRTGVFDHGSPLRRQEKTLPQALQSVGYRTAHFGKWHLNGLRGPGAPVLASDSHHPGAFGFGHWLTVTNFFDLDPLLSRMGEFEEFRGDSSEIIVTEALRYLEGNAGKAPVLAVIWFGTPHNPMRALPEDLAPFSDLPPEYANQLGELVAMDRAIGTLRKGLRQQGIAENTLLWFCSDNGGLGGSQGTPFPPETVGGLRGAKGTQFEGGLRVPAIIEWPARIPEGRVTDHVAGTVDIFPTIADVLDLPADVFIEPVDGISLLPLIEGRAKEQRPEPLGFRRNGQVAVVEQRFKYLDLGKGKEQFLFDLVKDPAEKENLLAKRPKIAARMKAAAEKWNRSVEDSVAGKDYPEGRVNPQPERRFWHESTEYQPYLEKWKKRPEFKEWFEKHAKRAAKQAKKADKQ